jgi:hypothetical protein
VSWICPDAAGWLAHRGSRVPGLLLLRP